MGGTIIYYKRKGKKGKTLDWRKRGRIGTK
jgi:hypothetical protein